MKKHIHITNDLLSKTLASVPVQGKHSLEPLKAFSLERGVPMNVLEDKEVENDAEVHFHEADLWLCLEGEITFICGGEMVNPWFKKAKDGTEDKREQKAKEIKDGETINLKPGEWLWIPAGVPHTHKTKTLARLVIIKIPDKA